MKGTLTPELHLDSYHYHVEQTKSWLPGQRLQGNGKLLDHCNFYVQKPALEQGRLGHVQSEEQGNSVFALFFCIPCSVLCCAESMCVEFLLSINSLQFKVLVVFLCSCLLPPFKHANLKLHGKGDCQLLNRYFPESAQVQ